MDIYERYEALLAELDAFLAEERYGQEVGQYYARMAKIQSKILKIEMELIGSMLALRKKLENEV